MAWYTISTHHYYHVQVSSVDTTLKVMNWYSGFNSRIVTKV